MTHKAIIHRVCLECVTLYSERDDALNALRPAAVGLSASWGKDPVEMYNYMVMAYDATFEDYLSLRAEVEEAGCVITDTATPFEREGGSK
jgi:hypothetical protein